MNTGKRYMVPLIFPVFLLVGCITPADIPFTIPPPEIVVEGLITDQPGTYEVFITRTASYLEGTEGTNLPVTGATVFVRDDAGNEEMLFEYQPGEYMASGSIQGMAGRSYSLSIILQDGTEIESYPEKMSPVPDIDSLYYEFQPVTPTSLQGHQIFATVSDPPGEINFYRWKWKGYYNFSMYNEFSGYSCMKTEFDYNEINLQQDRYIDGNDLLQPVAFIPHFANTNYLVHVFQQSLTQNAYDFWVRVNEQGTQTGSIFDRIPSKIRGNLYYADGREETVYGYFGASSISLEYLMMNFQPGLPPAYPRTYEVRPCYTYPNSTDFLINDPGSWPEGWGEF